MRKSAWFIFLSILAASCLNEPDCYQLNNNVIGVSFRVMGSDKPDSVAVSLQIAGSSEPIDTTVTFVGIQLNITKDQTPLTFLIASGDRILNLGYSLKTQFVSEECGSRYIFSDLRILNSTFDSARVVNSTPGKNASINIEAFRCPQTNIMTVSFRDLYINSQGDSANRAGPVKLINVTDGLGGNFHMGTYRTTYKLYVNPLVNTTTFEFHIDGESAPKKLSVTYTGKPEERYDMCNTQTFITALKIQSSGFVFTEMAKDENGRPRTTLTDPSDPNLYLYRCPITNQMKIDFKSRTSPTSQSLRSDTVSLLSVVSDYNPTELYKNAKVSNLVLAVNPKSIATNFYIKYAEGGRIDTLNLSYDTIRSTLFQKCGIQKLYSNLKYEGDTTRINVLQTDSLRFPAISNLEIINN